MHRELGFREHYLSAVREYVATLPAPLPEDPHRTTLAVPPGSGGLRVHMPPRGPHGPPAPARWGVDKPGRDAIRCRNAPRPAGGHGAPPHISDRAKHCPPRVVANRDVLRRAPLHI